ncbi:MULTISPECIES: helicase-related protein [unclassified Burkholderia]|uniref:helicase-related protein n=1 Tax=unclassified Burkholderia TaxID=2613784 RepID=UPI002AB1B120|nr:MULTISPECIES: helicase-related protein [unclassified Burkholderia]
METYRQLGLAAAEQMLMVCPTGYDDLRVVHTQWSSLGDNRGLMTVSMCAPELIRAFTGDKVQQPTMPEDQRFSHTTRRLDIPLRDARGEVAYLGVFGNIWAWKDKQEGDPLALIVSAKRFGRNLYLQDLETVDPKWVGRVRPRYRGIPGKVAAERIERDMQDVVESPAAYEVCREMIVKTIGWPEEVVMARVGAPDLSLVALLRRLHAPENAEDGLRSQALAARVSSLAVQCNAMRENVRRPHQAAALPVDGTELREQMALVNPPLTEDQRDAIEGVMACLTDSRPMNGLLTGDVGTGKTLTYLLPAVAAWRAGARVAIVAPTVIVADQIAHELLRRFPEAQIVRAQTGDRISEPSAIQVGTVGLVNEAARSDYVPNLLIVDEQHRLSVEQRRRIVRPWTHVLEVTATPIPRTVALAHFSGIDHFMLRQAPVEKEIWSGVLDGAAGDRARINKWLSHAVATGARSMFVYPSVEKALPASGGKAGKKGAAKQKGDPRGQLDIESSQDDAGEHRATRALLDAAAGIESAFPTKVAVLHGQMSEDAVRATLEQFRSGEKLILVATSIVEIGVDLPDLRLAVVVGADRFGLAQLHQLRGRLARQGGRGAFAMFIEDAAHLSEDARARLDAVASIRDGFALAEKDLELRGFGQLDEGEQSGATQTLFRGVALAPGDFFDLSDELAAYIEEVSSRFDETPVDDPMLAPLDEDIEGRSVTGEQIRLI